jgi:predicted permease
MFRDIRFSFRSLCQAPAFAITAILSVALAVGANSTTFSWANGLLLRPLPVPDPEQVLTLRSVPLSMSSLPVRGYKESRMSYRDFEDFRSNMRSFERLVAYEEFIAPFAPETNTSAEVKFKLGYRVSGDFFQALRIEPQLGRAFRTDEESVSGKNPVVILSHDLWENEFGGDPSIIGQRVNIDGVSLVIIGVAPESFTGMDHFIRPDFLVPVTTDAQADRNNRRFIVKGRLRRGTPIRSAAAEAVTFAKSLEGLYPATNKGLGATVNTELEFQLISWPILGSLVGAISMIGVVVLFIACANIANLMLSRGRARAREIGVRLAIGSSRGRLIRLLLTESLMIAFASAPFALLAARSTEGVFSNIDFPSDRPIKLDFHMDERVVWFTIVAAGTSALLFRLIPALKSTRLDLMSVVKGAERDQARQRLFAGHALVVVQIAGCMILLVLASEGRHNFNRLLTGHPGFRKDHVITMRFDPTVLGYSEEQVQPFYETLLRRVMEISGIRSAALTSGLPMTNEREYRQLIPEGYEFPPGADSVNVLSYAVDDHYFETFGVPLLAGRGFRATDDEKAPRVIVVNEAFAKDYLGPQPIGKRVWLDHRGGQTTEVVGMTMTGKALSLIEPPTQVVFVPLSQIVQVRRTLIAETIGDPARMAAPLQDVVRSIDPSMPIFRVRTMEDIFERGSVNTIRTVSTIYDFAAALGMTLALVGMYAVIAYQVRCRTREIGVRMALGATPSRVIHVFLRQAVLMSVSGILIGVVLSAFAGQFSESALGQAPFEPFVVAAVAAALSATAIASAAIPARHAARVDPQQALRQH